MGSVLGEDGVDREGVVHGRHAELVPGEAMMGAVYLNGRVECYFAVGGEGRGRGEGDRAARLPDGEGALDGQAVGGRGELVQGEGDRRVLLGVEEVRRAQMSIALGHLGV